jgi:hypothetical protein
MTADCHQASSDSLLQKHVINNFTQSEQRLRFPWKFALQMKGMIKLDMVWSLWYSTKSKAKKSSRPESQEFGTTCSGPKPSSPGSVRSEAQAP